jgi:hypothetical protein
VGEAQAAEHAGEHGRGVLLGVRQERAALRGGLDVPLGRDVERLLAVGVAAEEGIQAGGQALLLGEDIGLPDVQDGGLELRPGQGNGHRGPVRRDLNGRPLQAAEVDEGDIGADPDEQGLAARHERRQEGCLAGQVDDYLVGPARRLVAAERGDRLQHDRPVALGGRLGERIAQLGQDVHDRQDEQQDGRGRYHRRHRGQLSGQPAAGGAHHFGLP